MNFAHLMKQGQDRKGTPRFNKTKTRFSKENLFIFANKQVLLKIYFIQLMARFNN